MNPTRYALWEAVRIVINIKYRILNGKQLGKNVCGLPGLGALCYHQAAKTRLHGGFRIEMS
jgi:hypothetical protein